MVNFDNYFIISFVITVVAQIANAIDMDYRIMFYTTVETAILLIYLYKSKRVKETFILKNKIKEY